MMTSYFVIRGSSQLVLQDHLANLFDLIGLCVTPLGLQVQDFFNAVFREDVMVAPDAFLKAQMVQQLTQSCKRDVGIGRPAQDS